MEILRKDERSSPLSVLLKPLLQVAQGCWEPAPCQQPPFSCRGNTWVTHLGWPVRPLEPPCLHIITNPCSLLGKHLAPHPHPALPALKGLHAAQQGRNHRAVPARQASRGMADPILHLCREATFTQRHQHTQQNTDLQE